MTVSLVICPHIRIYSSTTVLYVFWNCWQVPNEYKQTKPRAKKDKTNKDKTDETDENNEETSK